MVNHNSFDVWKRRSILAAPSRETLMIYVWCVWCLPSLSVSGWYASPSVFHEARFHHRSQEYAFNRRLNGSIMQHDLEVSPHDAASIVQFLRCCSCRDCRESPKACGFRKLSESFHNLIPCRHRTQLSCLPLWRPVFTFYNLIKAISVEVSQQESPFARFSSASRW